MTFGSAQQCVQQLYQTNRDVSDLCKPLRQRLQLSHWKAKTLSLLLGPPWLCGLSSPVYATETGTFCPPHGHLLPFTTGSFTASNLPQDDAVVQPFQTGVEGLLPWAFRLSVGVDTFSLCLCERSPGSPSFSLRHARDANGQLQTVSGSEYECGGLFVFLSPAINWQLVHSVALPLHPQKNWDRLHTATLNAGEAVYSYSASAF